VILVAGLWPFQFRPVNAVEWLRNPDGIRFQKWGIAYSKDKLVFGDQGLTIELVAESLRESNHSIAVLLELFESRNSRWLMVGQWRSNLILRWSDGSTGGKKKYQEMGVKDAFLTGSRRHFVITTGKDGTSIYVDGVLTQNTLDRLPFGSNEGREGYLALGNFAGGHDQWYGSIYRLAIYNAQLDSDNLKHNSTGDTAYLLEAIKASYEYAFNRGEEGPGNLLVNINGTGGDISIPKAFNIPEKTILKAPWKEFGLKRSYLKDVVINLFGFIPLGFTFAFFLWKNSGLRAPGISALVVAIGFSTSLTIEILQAFTPSRSSSIGDLLFNTLGTVIGVVLMNSYWRRFWETKRLNKRCEKG
ncbi:MAG: VanZ family protein, partial [bacterium]